MRDVSSAPAGIVLYYAYKKGIECSCRLGVREGSCVRYRGLFCCMPDIFSDACSSLVRWEGGKDND